MGMTAATLAHAVPPCISLLCPAVTPDRAEAMNSVRNLSVRPRSSRDLFLLWRSYFQKKAVVNSWGGVIYF